MESLAQLAAQEKVALRVVLSEESLLLLVGVVAAGVLLAHGCLAIIRDHRRRVDAEWERVRAATQPRNEPIPREGGALFAIGVGVVAGLTWLFLAAGGGKL